MPPSPQSVPATHDLVPQQLSDPALKAVFAAMTITMIFVNFDAGATSAVLDQLSEGCGDTIQDAGQYPCLTESEKGVLGALPYCGLFIGCPIVAALMTVFGEKSLLLAGLVGEIAATIWFTFVTDTYKLFLAKFAVGLGYSALRVYAPVWVNDIGPARMRASWLGVVQATGPLGILCGYALAGYLTSAGIDYQWAFRIQAGLLGIGVLCLLFCPKQYLDRNIDSAGMIAAHTSFNFEGVGPSIVVSASVLGNDIPAENATPATPAEQLTKSSCHQLISNRIYLLLVSARSCLFFIVTSIQYWTTSYFINDFGQNDLLVHTVYILISGTAPLIGIAMGGRVIDTRGGYATLEGQYRSTQLCVVWACIASCAGIGLACIQPGLEFWRFMLAVGLMWVELLFGAALLPPTAGLVLQSVDQELRVHANAAAMCLYMVIGYGLGTWLPGEVQSMASQTEGTVMGFFRAMQVSFLFTVPGFTCLVCAYVATRRKRHEANQTNSLLSSHPTSPTASRGRVSST